METVFFLKKNNHLFKRLYLSSIYQHDQGMTDPLSVGKAVLKQLIVDGPQIQTSLQNRTMQVVTRIIICHRH